MEATVTFNEELLISGAMTAGTTFFHAIIIAFAAAAFRAVKGHLWGPMRVVRDSLLLTMLGVVLMAAHTVEIAAWAILFLNLGAFDAFEPAFYFASVSYTTLGFGDILLPHEWRLLAGAVAADGLLLFGLSAAFLVEMTSKLRLSGER